MPPVPARPLLFLDYDGTLAPIVDDPAQAGPHPDVPALLRALADRHPVVVVTGRDLAALGRLLMDEHGEAVPVRAVGLHGTEEGRADGTVTHRAIDAHADALAALRQSVPEGVGVEVEPKGAAFAVHYRRAADEDVARSALERWAEGVPEGLVPIWGKKVVELRPEGISKGTAVARIALEHPDLTPVYVGDDVTDEDAFMALADVDGAVTVKVGEGETAARWRLADVAAVVGYLRAYLPDGSPETP